VDFLNLLQSINLENVLVEKSGAQYKIKLNDAKLSINGAQPLILEHLEVDLQQLSPPQGEIQDFNLKVPKEVLEVLLGNFKHLLEEKGVSDIKLKLMPGKIEIKGNLKKAMNLPFTLEIYPKVVKNKLKVEIGQIQVMEIFSLPGLVKDIILSLVRNKVPVNFIAFDAQGFLIDINMILPLKLNLNKIEISE